MPTDPPSHANGDDFSAAMDTSFARLRELFAQVSDLPKSDREPWILAHVTDHDDREALRRLLAADSLDDGYLDIAAEQHVAYMDVDETVNPGLMLGQRVGAFKLTRLLGKGGMAIVFLGEREEGDFEQCVAVKLLQRGLFSEIEQRLFRRERQLLAGLEHPNIARLIDGGVTPTGIPYLALEYVDGEPVTTYAADRRLDVRARLALFLIVCRAVEAAHRALIVHRDIKPSNILVAKDDVVKLLDFGIAKLLADDTENPTAAWFTPEYAAPEQRANTSVTTATDVYSLGILFHELLLGIRPQGDPTRRPSSVAASLDPKSITVPKPMSLPRALRGDIDTIILKCLAEEPAQRYASAGTLADDVERYLAGKPVEAHPPSRWYRARKFVHRHRGSVAVTALLVLAIFATLALFFWQARVAHQEAVRANTVRDFLISVFKSAGADLPKDKRPTAEDLVDEASAELTAKNDLPDTLRSDLLMTLAKVADSAGSFEQALTLLDRDAPIAERLYSAADAQWWDERVTLALVLRGQAHFEGVVSLLSPLREGLQARHDEIGIDGVMLLGNALLHVGHVDEGLQLVRAAREITDTEAPHLPDAYVLSTLIEEESTLTDAQKFREALDCGDAALALWQRQGSPPSQSIIALYSAIALDSEAVGDIPRAEEAYKQSIALGDKFFDKANPSTAWNVGMYGTFLIAQGRLTEAEPFVRRGLEMRRTVFGDENSRTLNAVAGMGKLYAGQNKFPEAEQWYTQGIDVCRKIALNDVVCPRLLSNRARAYSNEARFSDAERDIREALQLQEKVGGDANPAYAYILDSLVVVQLKQHQDDAAIASADRSLAIYKNAKGGMIQAELSTRFQRARALFEAKRNDEALREILEIEPRFSSLFPSGASRFNMLVLKAQALAAADRAGEARAAALDALSQPKKPPSLDPKVIEELHRLAGNP